MKNEMAAVSVPLATRRLSLARRTRARRMPRPRGVGMIERLVVVGLIAILAGLLLPAVQSAHEAGRRLTCADNLREMGLAAQQHEALHGVYPRRSGAG